MNTKKNINKKDLKFEYMRGKGPGGQNRNKVSSTVRVTHLPTNISVTMDGRDQFKNKRMALKELEKKLLQLEEDKRAQVKKEQRDKRVRERKIIRTYNFQRGEVKDHRSKKIAPLDDVLRKGKIDLMYKEDWYKI